MTTSAVPYPAPDSDMIDVYLHPIAPAGTRREDETIAVANILRHIGLPPVTAHTENGAPFIAGRPDLRISVSHSATLAAIAIAGADAPPFGIDIETDRHQLRRVASRFLSDAEQVAAVCIPSGLLRAWTAKEAVYKAALTAGVDFSRHISLGLPDMDHAIFTPDGRRFDLQHVVTAHDNMLCIAVQHNKMPVRTLIHSIITPKAMNTRRTLVFATNNRHKLDEIRNIAGQSLEILSLDDIGCHDDIPEDAPTLEGNALAKARWVKERYGYDCFADDTGLEVEALDGAPGVHSARYAPGDGHDAAANTALLLHNLSRCDNRRARFRTVIALIADGQEHTFQGIVEGSIAHTPAGDGGFGYDPVFVPEGDTRSFAQYTPAEKNAISHRGRATAALLQFLLHS